MEFAPKDAYVTDCRYFGITISVKNWDLDLKRQKRRFYANTNMLLKKIVKCSPDVKSYLFKTYFCIQARQTRPNSGGFAEGHPRFDKGGGGVAIIFYFLRVKNRTF